MTNGPGYIQLQRALDTVHVGRRHRAELGDIDALAASIDDNGLFQIITIDPDGNLVCGLRRLVAMRRLGWKTADVWVRPGISDRLGQLLAEQDDNALHKPLTLTEQTTLYRELKTLMAEDAARRQEASRFQAGARTPRSNGPATVAGPLDDTSSGGEARAQAALMVTGRNSYTSLERIGELQRLAADPTQPAAVRERAAAELEGIDAGGSITAAHQRTRVELSLAKLDQLAADSSAPEHFRAQAARDAAGLRAVEAQTRAAELERLAADALARVRGDKKRGKRPRPTTTPAAPAGVMTVRAFVLTWDELALWWERADPAVVGPALTEEQWHRFEQTVAGTVAFAEAADQARRETELRTA
ncbi:MAG: ParB N-terminal domain-containing protein [Actinomycetes bacterium]